MTEHYLGRHPDIYATCSDDLKKSIIKQVIGNIKLGMSFENCCWDAECPPEVFEKWRQEDARLHKACMKSLAGVEKELLRELREGGRGMSQAKAALEILQRTFRHWTQKSAINLTRTFEDALVELEKVLPAETYGVVVGILNKHQ